MAAVLLPQSPYYRKAVPGIITYRNDFEPMLGGEDQRLFRLGERYGILVELPRLSFEQARVWIPLLLKGSRDKVIWRWPQPRFAVGVPGAVLINGALAANNVNVPLKALTSGYVPQVGQWLTVVHSGIRYLHQIVGYTVSTSTTGTAEVWPPTRSAFSDGDVVKMDPPEIEGFPQDRNLTWDYDRALTAGLSFTIKEAK